MTGSARSVALTRVTGAAILDRVENPARLLVAQRAYPEKLRGLWEFPGGKQDPGESAREALVRECREELSVPVTLLEEVSAPSPDGWPLKTSAVMRVFTAVLRGEHKPVTGKDHLRLEWLPLTQPKRILGLDWIPADRPIVMALLEQLGVWTEGTPGSGP